jgi:hypothetical protein
VLASAASADMHRDDADDGDDEDDEDEGARRKSAAASKKKKKKVEGGGGGSAMFAFLGYMAAISSVVAGLGAADKGRLRQLVSARSLAVTALQVLPLSTQTDQSVVAGAMVTIWASAAGVATTILYAASKVRFSILLRHTLVAVGVLLLVGVGDALLCSYGIKL